MFFFVLVKAVGSDAIAFEASLVSGLCSFAFFSDLDRALQHFSTRFELCSHVRNVFASMCTPGALMAAEFHSASKIRRFSVSPAEFRRVPPICIEFNRGLPNSAKFR